jgi:hypothetical protein
MHRLGIDFVGLLVPACREMSKRADSEKPDKKVTRSITFPEEVYDRADAVAKGSYRSLNSYVVMAVAAQLDRDEEAKKKAR